jgi:hypothetical protein
MFLSPLREATAVIQIHAVSTMWVLVLLSVVLRMVISSFGGTGSGWPEIARYQVQVVWGARKGVMRKSGGMRRAG